jgi:hypothetical protein
VNRKDRRLLEQSPKPWLTAGLILRVCVSMIVSLITVFIYKGPGWRKIIGQVQVSQQVQMAAYQGYRQGFEKGKEAAEAYATFALGRKVGFKIAIDECMSKCRGGKC